MSVFQHGVASGDPWPILIDQYESDELPPDIALEPLGSVTFNGK